MGKLKYAAHAYAWTTSWSNDTLDLIDRAEGLGFDLVWFTVLFAVCLQTSFLTPPVGFALFYLKGVAPEGIRAPTIYRGAVPFISLQFLGLVVLFFWPVIVTWLPSMAYR